MNHASLLSCHRGKNDGVGRARAQIVGRNDALVKLKQGGRSVRSEEFLERCLVIVADRVGFGSGGGVSSLQLVRLRLCVRVSRAGKMKVLIRGFLAQSVVIKSKYNSIFSDLIDEEVGESGCQLVSVFIVAAGSNTIL